MHSRGSTLEYAYYYIIMDITSMHTSKLLHYFLVCILLLLEQLEQQYAYSTTRVVVVHHTKSKLGGGALRARTRVVRLVHHVTQGATSQYYMHTPYAYYFLYAYYSMDTREYAYSRLVVVIHTPTQIPHYQLRVVCILLYKLYYYSRVLILASSINSSMRRVCI